MQDIPDDAPTPRLCHVIKWPDFEGFGFNMHADKARGGQFIGKVDVNSPAEAAGLKEDDRIIEVNGVNISNENHKQVVQRIKLVPNETKLLVVDPETDDYYKSRNLIVKGTQSNVRYIKTPPRESPRPASSSSSVASSGPKGNVITPDASPKPSPPKESPKQTQSYTNGRSSSASSASDEDSSLAPAPRLCHVIKISEKDGYGFHLFADKKKQGHFIGKIDPGSPAETAGLKKGDRIIEVNGSNVTNETHKEVVQKIKAVAMETRLLVLDAEAEAYYKERNITVSSRQSNVIHLKTAIPPKESVPVKESFSINESIPVKESEEDVVQLRARDTNDRRSQISHSSGSTAQFSSSDSRSTSPQLNNNPPSSPTRPLSAVSTETLAAAAASGLNLGMSAAEMRARLANRKKYDPKKENMDLRQKHQIVQTM